MMPSFSAENNFSRTLTDLIAEALSACAATPGLECIETLELDSGKWERPRGHGSVWYRAESGTSAKGNAWLKLTAGNAKVTGDVQTPALVWHSWKEGGARMDREEHAAIERELRERAARQAERERQDAEAARREARAEWARAAPDCNGHPYLTQKGVQAHGIRRLGDHLIVPLVDMAGDIHCLQRIPPTGDKRFTKGGQAGGHFFVVGTDPGSGPIYFGEGYATCATIHEAMGAPVACCFNSGNLPKVAKAFRDRYPDRPFVIAGDDDRQTPANPGRKAAEKAAQITGGTAIFPVFQDPQGRSDFNDLHAEQGIQAVREQIQRAAGGAGDKPGPFQVVDLTGFMEAPADPVRWAIEPLVPRCHVTLLGGHGEAGKSMLALTLAAHVACGERWAGRPVTWGRVLYLSLEDDAPMVTGRLKRIAQAYGLKPDKVARNLAILDGTRAGPLAEEESLFGKRRLALTDGMLALHKAAQGCALVIVDNASDAFSASENDRSLVRQFMGALAGIARETEAAVMLLAHVDKNAARYGANGNSYSGSTAWHNSARSRLALLKTEEGVELCQEKLNLAKKAEPIGLAWSADGVLMPDNAPARQATAPNADDEAVLHAIREVTDSGQSVTTATMGARTVTHVLADLLPKPVRSTKRVNAALIRLERAGAIAREEYKDQGRKARERWICLKDFNSAPLIPPHTPLCAFGAFGAEGMASCADSGHCDEYRTSAHSAHSAQNEKLNPEILNGEEF